MPLKGRRYTQRCHAIGDTPSPGFLQVLILKRVKVFCFDTLLQVLILKGLTLEQIFSATGQTPFRRMAFPGDKEKNASNMLALRVCRDGRFAAGMQAQC
jgi:hypothetical protein